MLGKDQYVIDLDQDYGRFFQMDLLVDKNALHDKIAIAFKNMVGLVSIFKAKQKMKILSKEASEVVDMKVY